MRGGRGAMCVISSRERDAHETRAQVDSDVHHRCKKLSAWSKILILLVTLQIANANDTPLLGFAPASFL